MTDLTNCVIAAPRWPLHIHFSGLGELAPTDDVTPLEAVHLCAMLACATHGAFSDFPEYAKRNGLERHFKCTDEGKSEGVSK